MLSTAKANRDQPSGGKPRYFVHLDGLRCLAISLVMIEHFGGPLAQYFSAGYYGVDLFFVLSGFLITSILLKSQGDFGAAYKTFMGRRTLRIFPVYYLALAVLFVCNFASTRDDILWLGSYTWNYACAMREGENWLFYLWSLSVEEQFYLFWPFVVLTLRGKPQMLLVLTVSLVCISYSQLVYNIFPALTAYNYTGLINRMGSLGLGALGAIGFIGGWIPRRLLMNRMIELLTWALLVWALVSQTNYRLPVMGICSLILVLKGVNGDYTIPMVPAALAHPATVFVGRISYGIYVYHWPLGLALNEYVFDPLWLSIDFSALGPLAKLRWHSWLIKLPLYYAAVVAVAYLSYRYFESPLLGLKDRWFPGDQRKPAFAVEGASG